MKHRYKLRVAWFRTIDQEFDREKLIEIMSAAGFDFQIGPEMRKTFSTINSDVWSEGGENFGQLDQGKLLREFRKVLASASEPRFRPNLGFLNVGPAMGGNGIAPRNSIILDDWRLTPVIVQGNRPRAAAHEIGHVLGLEHTSRDEPSIMRRFGTKSDEWAQESLEDLNRLEDIGHFDKLEKVEPGNPLDVNDDGLVNMRDAIAFLNWRYNGGPEPARTDPNQDGVSNFADAMAILNRYQQSGKII